MSEVISLKYQMSYFDKLPNEIIIIILTKCSRSYKTLKSLTQVCKLWRQLCYYIKDIKFNYDYCKIRVRLIIFKIFVISFF